MLAQLLNLAHHVCRVPWHRWRLWLQNSGDQPLGHSGVSALTPTLLLQVPNAIYAQGTGVTHLTSQRGVTVRVEPGCPQLSLHFLDPLTSRA